MSALNYGAGTISLPVILAQVATTWLAPDAGSCAASDARLREAAHARKYNRA